MAGCVCRTTDKYYRRGSRAQHTYTRSGYGARARPVCNVVFQPARARDNRVLYVCTPWSVFSFFPRAFVSRALCAIIIFFPSSCCHDPSSYLLCIPCLFRPFRIFCRRFLFIVFIVRARARAPPKRLYADCCRRREARAHSCSQVQPPTRGENLGNARGRRHLRILPLYKTLATARLREIFFFFIYNIYIIF